MQYIKSTLALCAMALAAVPGCDERNGTEQPLTEEIGETEQQLGENLEEVTEQREDVSETRGELTEQQRELQSAKSDFEESRERFVQLSAAKLTSLDNKVEELRKEVEERETAYTPEQREEIIEALNTLNEKRAAVIAAIQAVQAGDKQQWDQLETTTAEALKDADDAYEKLAGAVRQRQ